MAAFSLATRTFRFSRVLTGFKRDYWREIYSEGRPFLP